tara:strand:- start:1245 stop:1556 length:312 start_codon:yes stop_codon:yes gene_type:complete
MVRIKNISGRPATLVVDRILRVGFEVGETINVPAENPNLPIGFVFVTSEDVLALEAAERLQLIADQALSKKKEEDRVKREAALKTPPKNKGKRKKKARVSPTT